MNKSIILHILGWISCFEAAFLILPVIVALIYGENSVFAFLITIGICLIIGVPLALKAKEQNFFAKEGFISVALGWILLSLIGSLPFLISGQIPNPVDALFEIVSGFTTTGSSILNNVDVLDKSMLLAKLHPLDRRNGVLVLVLAILPLARRKYSYYASRKPRSFSG